jgi:hypothetical protein
MGAHVSANGIDKAPMQMKSNYSHAGALRNAIQATLLGHAVTKEAKGLLADVFARVAQDQLKHEPTKSNAAKMRAAVDAFLADLLVAQSGDRPREWVYRALNQRGFTGLPVGYRVFLKVLASLKRLNLVEQVGGVAHFVSGFEDGDQVTGVVTRRYAARFCARPELIQLSSVHGVNPPNAAEHFAFEHRLPKHPLQKRSASKRSPFGKKLRGAVMQFDHTKLSERLEAELHELNEFLAQHHIEGGVHEGYIRIFQNGNTSQFNWNLGGRLYSTPQATNYQQLNKARRLKMTINEEAVAEIDIRASYLTIFHALHGKQLDLTDDPYNLPGLGKAGRDVVKMWMVATFGNVKPLSRWPRELVADYEDEHGRKFDAKRFPVRMVGEKAIAKHPLMEEWGRPLDGRILSWADLMYLESAAMISAMLDLKRRFEIPSLAVHDSLIVPRSKVNTATAVLWGCFVEVVKAKPELVTNPRSTSPSQPKKTHK